MATDCTVCDDIKQFRIGLVLCIVAVPNAIIMLVNGVCTISGNLCPQDQLGYFPLWISIPSTICGIVGLILIFTTKDDT